MSAPGFGRETPSVGGPHESEPGQAGERHVTTQTEVRAVHLTVQRNLRLVAAHSWLRKTETSLKLILIETQYQRNKF